MQPLSQAQITTILKKAGKHLAGLRQALDADEQLRDLTPLPLMLNLMLLAYQGRRKEDILAHAPLSDRQQQVLAAYVHRRLYQERVESARFTSEDTRRWLIWLAEQMTSRNQAEFYLEQLQPDWLPTTRLRRLYRVLVGLGGGLGLGLGGVLVGGLGGVLGGVLLGGLLVGMLVGLLIGGLAVLQHYTLRFLLYRTGAMPWRYVRFLDEAAGRLLLRKVGGGYVFVHRLVQEYFVSLERTPQSNSGTDGEG